MKIRAVGADMFHAEGRTDLQTYRHDDANSRFFAFLLTVFVLRVLLSSYMCLLYLMCICCTMCVLLFLLLMPDCWLEVSIRKVLRPTTSTQVFLGFPLSTSEC